MKNLSESSWGEQGYFNKGGADEWCIFVGLLSYPAAWSPSEVWFEKWLVCTWVVHLVPVWTEFLVLPTVFPTATVSIVKAPIAADTVWSRCLTVRCSPRTERSLSVR